MLSRKPPVLRNNGQHDKLLRSAGEVTTAWFKVLALAWPRFSARSLLLELVRPAALAEAGAWAGRGAVRQPRLVCPLQAGRRGQRLAYLVGALEPAHVAAVAPAGDEHRPGIGEALSIVAAGRRCRLRRAENEGPAEQQGARGENGTACHGRPP